MTGLNSDTGLGMRSDPWDSRAEPGSGVRYGHVRQESTASETGMLDAPREALPVPTFHSMGQSSGSNYSQDTYKDPYYRDPQRPQ
jgi:hypothetical protein